jgi:hypothetical protein
MNIRNPPKQNQSGNIVYSPDIRQSAPQGDTMVRGDEAESRDVGLFIRQPQRADCRHPYRNVIADHAVTAFV